MRGFLLMGALALALPLVTHAHQPRIVGSVETIVPDPEISKAYYGELTGQPHVFIIDSATEFALYANILVPDLPETERDVSVIISRGDEEIARLDASTREWERYHEEFAGDDYWRGPAYAAQVPAGSYALRVSSPDNEGRYALAIGEIEVFDGAEILNVLTLMPQLKRDFFETSATTFIFSIGGAAVVVALYACAFGLAYVMRIVLRRANLRRGCPAEHRIGLRGRSLRIVIALALLVAAISTSWSVFVILLSGFVFAEAILGWCVFCAVFGKRTCPVR